MILWNTEKQFLEKAKGENKMYSLIIPPDLVHELFLLREKFGVSIRAQILNSAWFAVGSALASESAK